MRSFTYVITAKTGLHARPAAAITEAAEKFSSRITIGNRDKVLSGKSLIGLLALRAMCGDTLVVTVDGPDERQAELALRKVFDHVLAGG